MTYRKLINNLTDYDFASIFRNAICEAFFENDDTEDCIWRRKYESCTECVIDWLKSEVQ